MNVSVGFDIEIPLTELPNLNTSLINEDEIRQWLIKNGIITKKLNNIEIQGWNAKK